jgi:hypothetical protein
MYFFEKYLIIVWHSTIIGKLMQDLYFAKTDSILFYKGICI